MKASFLIAAIIGISIAVATIVNPAAGVMTGSAMFAIFTRDEQ